jgi:hypothetical protein
MKGKMTQKHIKGPSATRRKEKYSQETQSSSIDYQAKDGSSTTLTQKKINYKKRLNSTPPQQQAPWR